MPTKKTRYSEVFKILLNNSAERRKSYLFDFLFGWIESNISEATKSQFNTGSRHLTDNYTSEFLKGPAGKLNYNVVAIWNVFIKGTEFRIRKF